MKIKKIELMCSKFGRLRAMDPLTLDHIGWPEKMLYNSSGEPVGYIMSFFNGTIPFINFVSKNFDTLISGCDKTHQVTMAVNFSALIDFLHHNNVILCDINRGNVLIEPKEIQVYLVDLDSAQIADRNYCYPSNVAVPEFLSPEHVYDDNFTFRRTKADDIWIMQMLLFRMLTPNAEPMLSSEDVEDDRDLIRRGLYPYQGGGSIVQKQPSVELHGIRLSAGSPPTSKRCSGSPLTGRENSFQRSMFRPFALISPEAYLAVPLQADGTPADG